MKFRLLFLGILCGVLMPNAWGQDCPALLSPVEGATNVPVESSISWEPVVGVTGYIISIGTSPGDTDIVSEQQVGNDTIFTPPQGLPELTTVYVTLTLFFFNQDNIVCPSQAFTTEIISTPSGVYRTLVAGSRRHQCQCGDFYLMGLRA